MCTEDKKDDSSVQSSSLIAGLAQETQAQRGMDRQHFPQIAVSKDLIHKQSMRGRLKYNKSAFITVTYLRWRVNHCSGPGAYRTLDIIEKFSEQIIALTTLVPRSSIEVLCFQQNIEVIVNVDLYHFYE